MTKIVNINCAKIHSMKEFHQVFKSAMGFPDFYGNNMNAWTDCMSWLDDPDAKMTNIHVSKGEVLVLNLLCVDDMISHCKTAYEALVDDVAFVNYRRIIDGEDPLLLLSYHVDPNR